MDPLVIGAIVVVLLVAAFLLWQRQRTQHLTGRYGPEYERTVDELGRRRAEAELLRRERRVEQLAIRSLEPEQRARFADEWKSVQARFVDDPEGAVTQGDLLVEEVMKARGYPVADFDQRIADLSVHHSRVVDNYREAREIGRRHRRGDATTEDLRQAMVYYRELFVDLLEDSPLADRRAERVVERAVVRDDYVLPANARGDQRRMNDREVKQ
jgi:hypothetical protein